MRLYTSKEIQNIVLNKWGIEDNIYYQVSSSNPNTYDLVYKGLKNGGLILLNKADLIAFRETTLNPNPLAQQAIEENTKLADSKVAEIQEGTAISVDNSTPTKPKVSFSGNLITDNEKAALDAANSPSGTNPFATINDLPTGGGTVTSVDLSMPSAFNVSGNPITTSGTIAISGAGTTSEYIRGDGTLDTFPTIPSISGLVPYIGATTDVDLGAFSLNAKSLHIKGTGGTGHLGLKHQSANITANANESSLGADSSGNPQWKNDGNAVDSLELQSNKSSSYTASSTTTYANTKALVDGLATKQNTLTNPITGTGTTNEIAYFSGATALASLPTATYPNLTELSYVKGVTSAIQTQINNKVTANSAITGATKTKITYDSKGLVTSGADATTADIADSTNKRYVTDAQLVVIGNTSGVNTGDQTSVSGNAGTATTLQTTRKINGIDFNGSADINTNMDINLYAALGSTLKAQNFTIDSITVGNLNFVNSNLILAAIWLNKAETLTGAIFYQATQGSYTANQENRIGLYTYSGGTLTLVASSVNDGNIFKGTSNTFQFVPFSSTYAASAGLYFIGLLWNASATTTAPQLGRRTAVLNANIFSLNFTNSAKITGTVSTTNSLPSTQAMSGVTVSTSVPFVGLY